MENSDDGLHPATDEEIERAITEYEPKSDETIVEILRGRVNLAINDQINEMMPAYGNPNEIKKLILRDIKLYIDSYEPNV